jgi:hypothetical protein
MPTEEYVFSRLFCALTDDILAGVENEKKSDPADSEALEDEYAAFIRLQVMLCLERNKFFGALDDRFSPVNDPQKGVRCGGNCEISTSILQALGYVEEDIDDIIEVMRSQGGFCDCEILYNVVEESRLKGDYWKSKALGLIPRNTHEPIQ